MKKFLFGFLALALIASNAFADMNLGGYFLGSWVVISGVDDGSNDLKEGFHETGRITASGETGDGKFGGTIRVLAGDAPNGGDFAGEWYSPSIFAFGWWKPIDQLKFQVGRNPDGDFNLKEIVGWGFNGEAEDVAVAMKAANVENPIFGGFGGVGASLWLTPMDGLGINFWMPIDEKKGWNGAPGLINPTPSQGYSTYLGFGGQVTYNLDGIGRIAVTYQNGTQEATVPAAQPAWGILRVSSYGSPSSIYASFLLTSVENVGVNFGVKYSLPINVKEGHAAWAGTDVTISNPIALGLGFSYGAGDFGVKAALNFDFLGNVKINGQDAIPIPFNFNLALLPYYDLGVMKAFLGLGINMVTDQEDGKGNNVKELSFGWYVNPYIQKQVGGGAFYAGIILQGNPVPDGTTSSGVGKWKNQLSWSIPVGLTVGL